MSASIAAIRHRDLIRFEKPHRPGACASRPRSVASSDPVRDAHTVFGIPTRDCTSPSDRRRLELINRFDRSRSMSVRPLTTLVSLLLVSRSRRLAAFVIVATVAAGSAQAQHAEPLRAVHVRHSNAVTHWNAIAEAAFTPTQGTNPMDQSRTLAIFHAAIHDALNAIQRRFKSYTPGLTAAPRANIDA